jgi:hypothetical protein
MPRFEKPFEILYREGHYMLYEEGLNKKIGSLKRSGKLIPLSADQINAAIRARAKSDCQAKPCSIYCFAPMERKHPFARDLEHFFNMPELTEDDRTDLAKRLSHLTGIKVDDFGSLAAFGQFLMHEAGCYEGVMGLRGVPAEFIRKCYCPIVLGTPHQKYPLRVRGSLTEYDRKSSYPHIYTSFRGIPMGEPMPILDWKPLEEWEEQDDINDARSRPSHTLNYHFYVCLDILRYECYHTDDPYPLIKQTGKMWMDRTLYRLILDTYEVEFKFVSGYYFQGYNTKIKDLTLSLYKMKTEADPKMARVLKNLMNGMWGKAMAKGYPYREKIIPSEKVERYCEFQGDYILSKRQLNPNEWLVKIVLPINANFTCPQFSVNVSSFSRKIMQEMIYKAVDMNIEMFYSNTDSICLLEDDGEKLFEGVNSGNLGDFEREFESSTMKFICLSPKKYIHCFADGKNKTCNVPKNCQDPEAYFERIYEYRAAVKPSQEIHPTD